VNRSKGGLNIQSKCHENENSVTHFKSSRCQVEGIKHTADINAYFLIKDVGK
jgi:hypothetical protein